MGIFQETMAAPHETATFVMSLTDSFDWDGRSMLSQPFSFGDSCKIFFCCCCPWADYSDGEESLRFHHSCIFCPCYDSCNWKVAHQNKPGAAFKDIGAIIPAGACENGCMWCMCPCCVCNLKNLKVAGFHTARDNKEFEIETGDHGNCDFTIRRDVACGDAAKVFAGMLCFCCLGPCSWCCKYMAGLPAIISSLPFYDKTGTTKYGEFQFASQIMCIGCCCIKIPVRYIVKSNKSLNKFYDAVLGLVPLLVRGLPTPCAACTFCVTRPPFPVPTGIDCFDSGLNSHTEWLTFQELCKKTASEDDKTSSAFPVPAVAPVQPVQMMTAPATN